MLHSRVTDHWAGRVRGVDFEQSIPSNHLCHGGLEGAGATWLVWEDGKPCDVEPPGGKWSGGLVPTRRDVRRSVACDVFSWCDIVGRKWLNLVVGIGRSNGLCYDNLVYPPRRLHKLHRVREYLVKRCEA